MSHYVPVREAAQALAHTLFPAYGQSWTPPDAADPVAVAAADAIQRQQGEMIRDARIRLHDGIKSGAVKLWMRSPNGDFIQANYDIVQCADPQLQFAIGRIIAEDYSSRYQPNITPYNDWPLFVAHIELDELIQSIGGRTINRTSNSSAPRARKSSPALESVQEALCELYPKGKPPAGLRPKQIMGNVNDWLKKKNRLAVSMDTIARALGIRK